MNHTNCCLPDTEPEIPQIGCWSFRRFPVQGLLRLSHDQEQEHLHQRLFLMLSYTIQYMYHRIKNPNHTLMLYRPCIYCHLLYSYSFWLCSWLQTNKHHKEDDTFLYHLQYKFPNWILYGNPLFLHKDPLYSFCKQGIPQYHLHQPSYNNLPSAA